MTLHERHDDPPVQVEPEGASWRAWLLGASFTVLLVFGGAAFQAISGRVANLESSGSPALRERVAAVETRMQDVERRQREDLDLIRETMRRIEIKLDTALDRLHSAKIPGYRPENLPHEQP